MTKKEIDDALRMAQPIVERCVAARFKHICEADRSAVANTILVRVWKYTLPRHNPMLGPLQNFLAASIRRLAINELDKRFKGKNKKVKINQRRRRKLLTAVAGHEASSFDNDATDRLAAELTISPELKLSPVQAQALRDYTQAGNIDALSRLWNCSRAATDQKLTRLRRAIRTAAGDSSDQRGHAQMNAA